MAKSIKDTMELEDKEKYMTVKEKILSNTKLNEYEVSVLIDKYYGRKKEEYPSNHFDGVESVSSIQGENRRWSRNNIEIFEVDGRYFGLDWEEGLTESQEDEVYEQVASEYEKIERIITDYTLKK